MKILLLVAVLLFLILPNIFGEIRNGYEGDISDVRKSLQRLKERLTSEKSVSGAERRALKENISHLTKYLTYYQVTEILLQRFRAISSSLYQQIDDLKDGKGRSVHVYVKFIPEDEALGSMGLLSIIPSSLDSTGCRSEYGGGTASIKIRTNNRALVVLSHEFGHLFYIVPNLHSYLSYYKNVYHAIKTIGELGHSGSDPSGMSAYRFERLHRLDYAGYRKRGLPKTISPMLIALRAKRSIVDDVDDEVLSVAATEW